MIFTSQMENAIKQFIHYIKSIIIVGIFARIEKIILMVIFADMN